MTSCQLHIKEIEGLDIVEMEGNHGALMQPQVYCKWLSFLVFSLVEKDVGFFEEALNGTHLCLYNDQLVCEERNHQARSVKDCQSLLVSLTLILGHWHSLVLRPEDLRSNASPRVVVEESLELAHRKEGLAQVVAAGILDQGEYL